MKSVFFIISFVVGAGSFTLQAQPAERQQKKPRLVIGIVVDQMRQEYLFRYFNKYGAGGFKKLMSDGFMLENAHYNYAPTVTGPGHASIYTGTTPAIHGIISNEWYDKNLKKEVNCVNDPQQLTVGSKGEPRVSASPWRMLSTTITDELKISTQQRSKVVGVSFKDRGAILPAGHNPDGAYWYDGKTGKFITSTYYAKSLPPWVDKFNEQNLADKYLSQPWTTLLPIDQYTESGPDDSPYESKPVGKDKPVFPYDLKTLRKTNGDFDLLYNTPFADDYLTEMAKAAIAGEKLGEDAVTDFLAVSYSAPDAIGHAVGPNAIELEDTYLRLDKNIEDLLNYLDKTVGTGNYSVFLSSDHGVGDVAQFLKDNKIPAGYFNYGTLKTKLNEFLQQYFPGRDEVVEAIDGDQIFLNQNNFQRDPKSAGVEFLVATELIVKYLMAQEGVANAYTENLIRQSSFTEGGIKGMITRGFHPSRSGDVVLVLEPGWYGGGRIQGTTHGSPYSYDTHVPVIFYGAGIKKGSTARYCTVTDIAPTISLLLNIKLPNAATGQPVYELFENK
jgi:predicted AlkP superfamily pyrophosphatase or phosphodiesterase